MLFISSFKPRGVSAYDLGLRKWIGYFPVQNSKLSEALIYPLKLSASDSTPETASYRDAKASIVVADFGPISRLLVAELDETFGAFAVIQSVTMANHMLNKQISVNTAEIAAPAFIRSATTDDCCWKSIFTRHFRFQKKWSSH